LRAACLVLSALTFPGGCGSGEPPPPPPPEVLVTPVAARDVPVVLEWLGTTEGAVDANIRAQISGYLVSQNYREGQIVKHGELLFRIDRRPFEAAVAQAQGDLQRAQAEYERNRLDVVRYTPLVKEGAVSQQEFDNAVQRQRGSSAAVESARAALDKAKIDLGFSEIRSPVDGIAGVARGQIGDLVGPTDSEPLTLVSQLDPIRVSFQVSEQEYLRYASRVAAAVERGAFQGEVHLVLADGSIYPHPGKAYPAGLGVDPRTGTITVKAEFPNPANLMRPGQYARVRAQTDVEKGALVVPQRALIDLQGRKQVAVVMPPENKVEVRNVEIGPNWESFTVVRKGVSAGDLVVTEGIQKARAGTVVSPKPAPPELAGAEPSDAPVASPAPDTKAGT
jgi:membrane fusion protein (multidrug efflux system)